MKKKRKKKSRQMNDGGLTYETIKKNCPKAKDIQMNYHSLSLKERRYITNWMLHKRMILFYATAFLEAVLILAMVVIYIADIGKTHNLSEFIWLIVGVVIVFLGMFILLWRRNKSQFRTIDFDKVQEVVLDISISKNHGTIMYYPYGTRLLIPKPKKM